MARTLLGRLVARAAPRLPDNVHHYLLTLRSLSRNPVIGLPPFDRAVVVAAHPDDDVIGAGGTIALLAHAGCQVEVVYVANGDGTRGSPLPPTAVAKARHDEAERAAERLGVASCHHFGVSDQAIADHLDEVTERLIPLLAGADVVMCPWFLDDNDDHQATAHAVLAAVAADVPVWMFEVWTPLLPNRIVDITTTADLKKQALAEHVTAGQAFDLMPAMGLSRYRSMRALLGRGYAEAFLTGNRDDLTTLIAAVSEDRTL
jgi:LmbE family N-acetylglucosaminyl deacetylase